jgi:VanZ family protein
VSAPPRTADTGTRLGYALLGYMLGVALIITLLPFNFRRPDEWRMMLGGDPVDVVANVLLFIPLGFFYRFAQPARAHSALWVLALGALVSAAIETAQLFEAVRNASPLDVAANATGAWLGALAADRVASGGKAGGRLVGWLVLELPLMGLVYLLVPLLWIDALSPAAQAARGAMAPLLAAFGALLLGGMQRHYFAPAGTSVPHRTAAFASLWFIAGAFPALAARPGNVVIGALGAGALCWWYGRRAPGAPASNRRFEASLLKLAAPFYAVYLVLVAIAPLRDGIAAWTLYTGFPDAASAQIEIVRLLELVAAFTLVGYMVAEFGGRALPRYLDAVPRLLAWAAALACALEALWGFRAGHGASLARGGLVAAAALYGGWLYYLQREHVVRLLAEADPQPQTQT